MTFSGFLAYRNLRQLRESERWVAHTLEVLDGIQVVLTEMIDAETGQRGYLLSGNPNYLEPYHDAAAKLPGSLARVQALTLDNAPQNMRILAMEALATAKLKELEQTIELYQRDQVAARRVIQTNQGKRVMDALRLQVEEITQEERDLLAERGRFARHEYQVALISGAIFSFLSLLLLAGGMVQLMSHFRQREWHERSARLHSQWLHGILCSIGDAVITINAKGTVTFMNAVAEGLTGWTREAAGGRPLAEVFQIFQERTGEPLTLPAEKILREGGVQCLATGTALAGPEGRIIPIEDSLAPIQDASGDVVGIVLVFRDITARRQAERETTRLETLLQKSKELQTLGVLAGGIAHDFNNILTTILGNANLGAMAVDPQGKVAPFLAAIETASLRAADLINQLMAYAGLKRCRMSEVDLGIVVLEIAETFTATFSLNGHATLHRDFAEGLPFVKADPTHLAQVLTNLIQNAAESIPDGTTGVITLRTREEILDEEALGSWTWTLPAAPGRYATLEVSDNGAGMLPGVAARAFEPFFTTKFTGRGLGLAAVIGILRSHGGGVAVRSDPGRGSIFKIFLPVHEHGDSDCRLPFPESRE